MRDCLVDLVNMKCECGKFQEFLIPCIHAVKKLQSLNVDPYYFVSSVYSKDLLFKLDEMVPVANIRMSAFKNKYLIKKKTDKNSSEENNSDQALEKDLVNIE